VRVAAVYADRKGYQYKEFEKNRGAFITGTAKLGKSSTLRLEVNMVNGSARRRSPTSMTS